MCGGFSNSSLPGNERGFWEDEEIRRSSGSSIDHRIHVERDYTFVLIDLIRIVDVGGPIGIHAHAHLADVRVDLSSVEPATKKEKKNKSSQR